MQFTYGNECSTRLSVLPFDRTSSNAGVQTGLPGSSGAVADGSSSTKYPAMSTEEIEDWLEHIPVFAVTNAEGAGIVLKPENDTGVFYFFMNSVQANATLQQLKVSSPDNAELKVSAFSLGKIWFNMLSGDSDSAVKEKSTAIATTTGEADDSATPTDKSTTTSTKEIQYRLVPDTRDLFGARMLLTMTPEDGEKLKENGSMTQEMAQAAIQKAMTESPKFKTMYNEIPVFTIAQMRMQKQPDDDDDSEPVTLLPMYFSLQNMIGTWQQFMSQAPAEVKGVEPAINLMSLHDLVDLMKKESEIDWRNVVLVPPTTTTNPSSGASTGMRSGAADSMAMMGGATLGDD
jgi:Tic22-like family